MVKKNLKKTVKKVVKKVVKETKKATKNKLEDVKYWQDRKADDTRKDWRLERDTDWVSEYWGSQEHPHRSLILEELSKIEFDSLLEVGSNCGPNLQQIRNRFPNVKLHGIDASPVAVEFGKKLFGPEIELGAADKLPVKEVDVILSDAVLMYAEPEYYKKIKAEFEKKAKKAIILIEWFDKSKTGSEVDGHWARDYQFNGFDLVERNKITEQQWPNRAWYTNGYVFLFEKK